jgi:hypothetical protein
MNRHPYLGAYMAGVTLPDSILAGCPDRFLPRAIRLPDPVPIERAIVFPPALIPNVFGTWNVLSTAVRRRYQWNIGIHGAMLPFLPRSSRSIRQYGHLFPGGRCGLPPCLEIHRRLL